MRTTHSALVAVAAWHGGFDGNPVAGLDGGYCRSYLDDFPSSFMSYREGILDNLTAYFSAGIVMDIRSADTNHLHLNQDIVLMDDFRHRKFNHFHLPDTG
jgi:hypothetical protein